MPTKSLTRSADLGLLLVAAVWGVNFSVLKTVMAELDPLAVNALRFPLAAAALWLALPRARRSLLPERGDVRRILLLGVTGHLAYQLCFIVGLDWTLAGNASLLLSTTPAWTVLLSALAGHERPGPWTVAGVAATVAGMTLVVAGRGDALGVGTQTVRGDVLMVCASVLWSLFTVGGLAPVAKYGPLRVTAWTLWIGTPLIVLLGLPSLIDAGVGDVSPLSWAGVAYSGLGGIALAYLLWYRGVERLGNTRTAVYSNLVPVAALVTAWLWLGEVPAPLQLLGAAVILAGLTVARMARVVPAPARR